MDTNMCIWLPLLKCLHSALTTSAFAPPYPHCLAYCLLPLGSKMHMGRRKEGREGKREGRERGLAVLPRL